MSNRVFAVAYTAPAAYKGGCLFGLAEFAEPAGEGAKVTLRPLDRSAFLWRSLNPQATGEYGKGFSRELGLTGGWYGKTENLYGCYRDLALTIGTDTGEPVPEITVGGAREPSDWWSPDGIALTPVLDRAGVMTGLSAPKAGVPVKWPDGAYDYAAATNAVGLTVSLTRATGVFKGAFKAWFDYGTAHMSKSLSYEGALTPVRENTGDGVAGRGFFLWPDKSVTPAYAFSRSYDFLLLQSSDVALAGGWSALPVMDAVAVAAAGYAVGAQNAVEGSGAANAITLIRITSARQQVVAGLNVEIGMEVKQGQSVRQADATVWRKLSGDYELTSWQWQSP